MNKTIIAASLALAVTFVSCQKEISGDIETPANVDHSILGTWKFVNMHGITSSSQDIVDEFFDVRTFTTSDYITINNKGTVVINDTAMINTNISYDVNTTAKVYVFENGNIYDSTDLPFNFSVPSTNSITRYTRIGTDSLYTPGGGFAQIAGAGGVQSEAGGCKYTLTGDTLVLTSLIIKSYTDNSSGVPVQVSDTGRAISTLSRH